MKSILILSFFFALYSWSAKSAELETISNVRDPELELMSSLHVQTHSVFGGCAQVMKEKVVKLETESWEKVLKQIIFKNNTEYSTPEGGIKLNKINMNHFQVLSVFVSQSFYHYGNKFNGKDNYLTLISKFSEILHQKDLKNKILFEGHHSNSFGASSLGAIVDLDEQEVIVFEAGYCE